jgi:hypothetical protein
MPPTEIDPGDPAEGNGADLVPARASPPQPPITQEELERVIRRASDLQFRGSATVGDHLDAGEVVRIGEEVGLEPRYVRQAMAEVQAAALVPEAPEEDGFARRLFGPGIVRASRVVPGGPATVERNLETYLKDRELMRPIRSRPGRSLWEPAGGLVSSMRRAMDVGGHGYTLAKARQLQAAVEPLEDGFSLVTLTADMGNLRTESAGGWLGGLGLVGAAGAAGLIIATGGGALAVLGGIGLTVGAVGGATAAARADVGRKRVRMELVLQGLLDRLERGENLGPDGEPWHQKLLR